MVEVGVQCGGLLELGVDDLGQDGQLARDLQHGAAVANSVAVVARGEHGDELPARKVLVAASDALPQTVSFSALDRVAWALSSLPTEDTRRVCDADRNQLFTGRSDSDSD